MLAKDRQIGLLHWKGTVSTSISGICIETYMNTELMGNVQCQTLVLFVLRVLGFSTRKLINSAKNEA